MATSNIHSTARSIISTLSDDESPYNRLMLDLDAFKSMNFAKRISLICECSIPPICNSCVIIIIDELDDHDQVSALIHINGLFKTVVNVTDYIRRGDIVASDYINGYEWLLRKLGIFLDNQEYAITVLVD